MFLHAGIDKDVDRSKHQQFRQTEPGDGDAIFAANDVECLEDKIDALRRNAFEVGGIAEQSVVEGHAAPHDGRRWIMQENDIPAASAKKNRNRGGDFIGPQHDCERRRWGSLWARPRERCMVRVPSQEHCEESP